MYCSAGRPTEFSFSSCLTIQTRTTTSSPLCHRTSTSRSDPSSNSPTTSSIWSTSSFLLMVLSNHSFLSRRRRRQRQRWILLLLHPPPPPPPQTIAREVSHNCTKTSGLTHSHYLVVSTCMCFEARQLVTSSALLALVQDLHKNYFSVIATHGSFVKRSSQHWRFALAVTSKPMRRSTF